MRRASSFVTFALLGAACAGSGPDASDPGESYSGSAAFGVYDDGSGRLGVAALVTIRDDLAMGPDGAWTLQLERDGDQVGAPVAYASGSAWAAVAWPDVAPVAGAPYAVSASDGQQTLDAGGTLGDGYGLAPPMPALSPDGTRLEWTAVAGAAAYACTLDSGSYLELQQLSSIPSCDVSGLPAGGYTASIEAFETDPATLPVVASPTMPASFDVSQARLGVLRRSAGRSLTLRAAGGRIDYGLVPGLALWVGLSATDGGPDGATWSIAVTGPNLPASDPLRFELLANFTRRMVWLYGLAPEAGVYTLTATSGPDAVRTQFVIAPPAPIPLPTGVAANGKAGGSARVTWDPVPGAQSYFASAWAGGTYVAGQWVAAEVADFPSGTFGGGQTYDVYVTATDVDMAGGTPPTRVSASENSYSPASFTAP